MDHTATVERRARIARVLLVALLVAVPIDVMNAPNASATPFTTPCTGVHWTLQDLEANSTAVGPGLWPGTYDLLDNVTVCVGDTLILEPGVQMWGHPGTWIRVEGLLEGNGTIGASVFLTGKDMLARWSGLRFEPGSRGYLSNCSVYLADVEILARGAQLSLRDCDFGGGGNGLRFLEGTVADAANVVVWDHEGSGVEVNASRSSWAGGEIVLSDASGLVATDGSVVRMDGTNVSLNTGGGILVLDSQLELRNSTVYRNYWPGVGLVTRRSAVNVYDTVFSENSYFDPSLSILNVDLEEADATFSNVSARGSAWAIRVISTDLVVRDSEIASIPAVVSSYGIHCFAGFPPSTVRLERTRVSDALVVGYDTCALALVDSQVVNGAVDIYGPARFSGNEFVNTTVRVSPDFHSKNDRFRDCDTAVEVRGESAPPLATRLDNLVVTNCRKGLVVPPSANPLVILGNGTLIAVVAVDATNGGRVFLLNTSVSPSTLLGMARIYTGHFLTVRALDQGDIPVAGARVVVSFETESLWWEDTDDAGNVSWIPGPSAVLASDSSWRAGTPVVSVGAPGMAFVDSPRSLDMVGPRTEVFRVDRVPPRVVRVSPTAEAVDVALTAAIVVGFDKPMDAASVEASISVSCAEVDRVEHDADLRNWTIVLSGPLAPVTRCTVTVSTAAKDLGGNALAAPFAWSFTTEASPDRTVTDLFTMIVVSAILISAVSAGIVLAVRRRRRREKSSGDRRPPPPPKD